MKKLQILIIVALLAGLAFHPGAVTAQKFSYVTGTQVQNLASVEASIVLSYYRLNESVPAAEESHTIPANSSRTFFPALTPFNGSVVISSNQLVGAVVNVLNPTYTAGASYVGASSGATTVSLPLLMKGNGGFDTWFSVQNAGGSDANISIKYTDCATPVTSTIKPNAARQFFQAQETCHTTRAFSATITSNQPIVVVALEENANTIFAYTGFNPEAASPTPVIPLVNANNSGYSTGIQIQNTSATATDVTVSYVPSGPNSGTACTEKQTIPGNQSRTFAFVALQQANVAGITTNCPVGAKLVGSARVTANTANVPLVAIVNQLSGVPNGGAYAAFNPGNATPKVVLPLLMDRNGGYYTGFSVMNVGSAATFVRCTLTGAAAAGYIPAQQLAPGAGMTAVQGGQVGEKYVGSGTCIAYTNGNYTTVDTNARIVAVVNELGPARSDQLLVYEGINVAP